MTTRTIIGVMGALAFALPSPAAKAAALELALCNGGRLIIPLDEMPGRGGDHRCCGKTCHAGDRKRKVKAARGGTQDC